MLSFSLQLSHSEASLGDGYPGKVDVFSANYVEYTTGNLVTDYPTDLVTESQPTDGEN